MGACAIACGYIDGMITVMITTIDRAGRVVIPKDQRERVGLTDKVEITIENDRIVIAPPAVTPVRDAKGKLRLPATGVRINADDVREARLYAQR